MNDEVIFILGKRGSGKSTLGKSVLARYNRVIVFDPMDEYHTTFDEEHGYTVFRTMLDFFDFFQTMPNTFRVACRFHHIDPDETEREYEYAAKAAKEIGRLLLVLEECEMFITSSNRKSYINYLISMGRHHKISMLAIGRRPSEIPIRFRANYSTIVAFNTTEQRDLQMLSAYGFDVDAVRSLGEHKYILLGKDIFGNGKTSGMEREPLGDTVLLREPRDGGSTPERNQVQPLPDAVPSDIEPKGRGNSEDLL